MVGEHSILPPSSAGRRAQCPASAVAELTAEDLGDKQAAAEGAAVHELAERYQRDSMRAVRGWQFEALRGARASNGVEYTERMHETAKLYADTVTAAMIQAGKFSEENVHIEQRVHAPRIHPESWGTPDTWIFSAALRKVWVFDLKNGHDMVEVFENWQLIEYAAGILEEICGNNSEYETQLEFEFCIVQPNTNHRDGPVRRWTIDGGALRAYFNIAADFEAEALGVNPRYMVGPKCRTCNARVNCGALHEAGWDAIAYSRRDVLPVDITPAALGLELQYAHAALEALKGRINGMEAQATSLLDSGHTVPHWAYETKRGRKRWRSDIPVEQVLDLGDMLGIPLRRPAEPVTPNDAIKAGVPADVVAEYSEVPNRGKVLVPSKQTAAHAVFSKR